MDDETRKAIEEGQPIVIIHFDKDNNITSEEAYNLENISLSKWQTESLARATLEACKNFYSDPENVKKYEAWKAERDAEKKK